MIGSQRKLTSVTLARSPARGHPYVKGSIVAAAEGDGEAAQRAKAMARLVLDHHR
jgi:hypothetical protein